MLSFPLETCYPPCPCTCVCSATRLTSLQPSFLFRVEATVLRTSWNGNEGHIPLIHALCCRRTPHPHQALLQASKQPEHPSRSVMFTWDGCSGQAKSRLLLRSVKPHGFHFGRTLCHNTDTVCSKPFVLAC